jgi:8-oxo-dGTP diphosphatase
MTEKNWAVAVKAFLVSDGKLLLVKRKQDNVQKPGIWEIPGGRLEAVESPFEGLKREIREEVGLEITVLNPLKVHHFTRDDGQIVTLIVFLCQPKTTEIKLGEEHEAAKWMELEQAKRLITPFFHEEFVLYEKHFQNEFRFKDK